MTAGAQDPWARPGHSGHEAELGGPEAQITVVRDVSPEACSGLAGQHRAANLRCRASAPVSENKAGADAEVGRQHREIEGNPTLSCHLVTYPTAAREDPPPPFHRFGF